MEPVSMNLDIPDLWFDFYARFLPGITFITILRIFFFGLTNPPNAWDVAVIVVAGYISALLIQPISSLIVNNFEKIAQNIKDKANKKDKVRIIIYKLGEKSHEALILEKMHGEIHFFLQLGIFLLIDCIFLLFRYSSTQIGSYIVNPCGLKLLFLFLAILSICYSFCYSKKRFKRAKRDEKAFNKAINIDY